MKGVNPEKWKNALGAASKIFGTIGDAIDSAKGEEKGLFDKQEQIDALNAQMAAQQANDDKQKKMIMYVAIGAAVLLLFGKKLMK